MAENSPATDSTGLESGDSLTHSKPKSVSSPELPSAPSVPPETVGDNGTVASSDEPDEPNESDEFGEFDEFDEFSSPPEPPIAASTPRNGILPCKSSEILTKHAEDLRRYLKPPMDLANPNITCGDGTTPTSQQLWRHLTEPMWTPLPRFESSLIYKQMAVNLGIPQNLDASCPHPELRQLTLSISAGFEEIAGLAKVPEWILLAGVSSGALNRMSEEELEDHISRLSGVISEAQALEDHISAREMDLQGEKNVLEGMVDSLLVFSQRNHRRGRK